jgi:hypothetical protein
MAYLLADKAQQIDKLGGVGGEGALAATLDEHLRAGAAESWIAAVAAWQSEIEIEEG